MWHDRNDKHYAVFRQLDTTNQDLRTENDILRKEFEELAKKYDEVQNRNHEELGFFIKANDALYEK